MADPGTAPAPRVSRDWRLWGLLCAALLIAAAIVAAGAPREPDSVAHVRAFLTALREQRVADALALAGVDRPRGDLGRFVTAKALSDDWEIVALREDYRDDGRPARDGWSAEPGEAAVEVAIRAAGETATFRLSLTKPNPDGEWRIEDPLQKVVFPATGMLYVDVNGVKAPVDKSAEESVHMLLPGAYRFFTDVPGVAKVASKPTLVVPVDPDEGIRVDYDATVTLTPKGERAALAALKAYIDECARSTELGIVDCPFGADPDIGPRSGEYRDVRDFRKVTWEVLRYPKAALLPALRGITLADRRRGSVKVTVTATEEATNQDIRYSVTCEMRLNNFGFVIGIDGKLVMMPPYGRFGDDDTDKETRAYLFDTCPP